MDICLLLTNELGNIPSTIEVVQGFGTERIVDSSGNTLASGSVVFLSGAESDFIEWLKDKNVWQSNNPMIGGWRVMHIKPDLYEASITIPKTAWNQFKKEYKNMSRDLRMGQAFHQWYKLDKVTSDSNKQWADQLYNASASTVTMMIESRLDYYN